MICAFTVVLLSQLMARVKFAEKGLGLIPLTLIALFILFAIPKALLTVPTIKSFCPPCVCTVNLEFDKVALLIAQL